MQAYGRNTRSPIKWQGLRRNASLSDSFDFLCESSED